MTFTLFAYDYDDNDDDIIIKWRWWFYLMSGSTMLCHLLRTSYTGLDGACGKRRCFFLNLAKQIMDMHIIDDHWGYKYDHNDHWRSIDDENTTDCYDDQKWNFKTESNTSRMGCRYFKHVFCFLFTNCIFPFFFIDQLEQTKLPGLIGIWNNIWRTKEWISFSLFAVYYIFYILNILPKDKIYIKNIFLINLFCWPCKRFWATFL